MNIIIAVMAVKKGIIGRHDVQLCRADAAKTAIASSISSIQKSRMKELWKKKILL